MILKVVALANVMPVATMQNIQSVRVFAMEQITVLVNQKQLTTQAK
jgi:hypothetical protein